MLLLLLLLLLLAVVLTAIAALLRMRGHRGGLDPLDGGLAAAAGRGPGGAALLRPLRRPLWFVLLLLLVHVLLMLLDLLEGSFVHRRCHHGKLKFRTGEIRTAAYKHPPPPSITGAIAHL